MGQDIRNRKKGRVGYFQWASCCVRTPFMPEGGARLSSADIEVMVTEPEHEDRPAVGVCSRI